MPNLENNTLKIGIIATKSDKLQNNGFLARLISGIDYEVLKINNWDENSNLNFENIELVICYLPIEHSKLDYSIGKKITKEVNKTIKLFRKLEVEDVIVSSSCRALFVSGLFLDKDLDQDYQFNENYPQDLKFLNEKDEEALSVINNSRKKINYDYRQHDIDDTPIEINLPLNATLNSMPFSVGFDGISIYDGRSVFITYVGRIINILSSIRNKDSRSTSLTIVDENLSDLTFQLINMLSKKLKNIKLMSFNQLKSQKLVEKYLSKEGLMIEIERDFHQPITSDYALIISNEFIKCEFSKKVIVIDLFGSYMGSNITIDNLNIQLPIKIPCKINSLDLIELLLQNKAIVDPKKLKIKALCRNYVEVSL